MAGAADPRRGNKLLVGLILVNLVGAMISSVGAPLIPDIASADHVSLLDAQWSLTIAVLVSVVATPLTGRLADGPHRRRVMLTVLAAAALGGVLAAASSNFGLLLVGRGLQGLGMGVTPLAIAVARAELPEDRIRPGVGLLSITNAVGIGLGYPVTGLVATWLGIHGTFWFAAAVSAVALAAGAAILPAATGRPRQRVDITGAAMLAASLGMILIAISEGPVWGWASGAVLGLLSGGVIVAALWAWHELRAAQPLVNLRLLRHRAVLAADVTGLVAGVGMYLLLSLGTRISQAPVASGGFGASTVVVGLALVPFSAATLASSRLLPAVRHVLPRRLRLPAAAVLSLAAMAVFAAWHGALWQLLVVNAVAGLGIGLLFSLIPELIVGSVDLNETGSAMSFNQVIRYVGYSVGSALAAVVLQAYTPAGHPLPTTSGYTAGGLVACAAWAVTGLAALALSPGARTAQRPLAMTEPAGPPQHAKTPS
jgi:MFS family permease